MGRASSTPDGRHAEEQAAIERWVATWRLAGAELERMRRAELRAMTSEEMHQAIHAIFAALPFHRPRSTSGLVEMQRLLSRLS